MTRIQKLILFLFALCLRPTLLHAALVEIASVTATSEGGYGSALIDTTNGFMAFGSSDPIVVGVTTASYISTFQSTPTFQYSGRTIYFSNIADWQVGLFDPGTSFGYWVSSGSPAVIQKVTQTNPPTFSGTESSMTFRAGMNNIGTGVIDTTNHFAYFGTQTSPAIIVKVQIPDGVNITSMSIISTITLPSGLDFLSASVIDVAGGFAYFGSSTTTGAVAKIKLSDFTLAGTVTFNSGEGGIGSAVIDTAAGFAYFGTHDSPGKVIKVRLASLTETGVQTMLPGDNDLTSAVIDPSISLAIFGTNTSSGVVIPIRLNSFTKGTGTTLIGSFLRSAVIDTTNHYAFFGTYTTPGTVIQVDLLGGFPEIFAQPANAIIHPGEVVALAILAEGRGLTYQWQRNGIDIPGANSTGYSFAASAADDGAAYHCVVSNVNGATVSSDALITIIPVVKVYPNPWRLDRHTGLNITFDGLLPNTTVKIFNLAAHWVKTLPAGTNTWDLKNDGGQMVASGYYFYLATTGNENQTSRGMIAVIR